MQYSKLFGKTLKTTPGEVEAISHKLLIRAGFIDQAVTAGVYSFLPLGWRVYKKVEEIIREEMNNIGGQELYMPTLQPKALWEETDRWDHMEPPLFKLKDRHKKELCLGPTHEEVMADIIRRFVTSYRDLPLYLYHIQNKFRNEMRATGGLLRVREFMMKDLYSFHENEKDLDDYYWQVVEAYKKIFSRCGFKVKVLEAGGGTIGGDVTHEFMMLCPTGEDRVVCCPKCGWAANFEIAKKVRKCKKCGARVAVKRGIENGHVFELGTKYSKAMRAVYRDKNGKEQLIWMGCYGIGLGRLMATVIEAHHDENGIIWPKSIAPYQLHLIDLEKKKRGREIYRVLLDKGIEVLWDDRDISAGIKFADADLIGIPVRLVVSEKTGSRVEWKERGKEKTELIFLEEAIKRL